MSTWGFLILNQLSRGIRSFPGKQHAVTGLNTPALSSLIPLRHQSSLSSVPATKRHCPQPSKHPQRIFRACLSSHPPIPHLTVMKMDTPEFRQLFTPELKKLSSLFEKYNYELRIAGGAVRDLLLGKVPHDIDFATDATPTQMKEMFTKEEIRMINTRGESHGTITCRINNKENFEVTTLRIDVVTDGRHAEVEFTTDWQLDALRRDLTINSLFLGLDGTIHDYFGGIQDVEDHKVRFVGDPVSRIQEDYLRILRYFRFYGRIAKEPNAHEQGTLRAIKENMHGLEGISGERIWVELKKIVIGNHAGSLVRTMMELGMAKYLGFEENVNTEEFDRVWNRCKDLDPQPFTVIPALMKYDDEIHKLNKRLKVSREEKNIGLYIIQHREDAWEPTVFRHCQDLLCLTTSQDPKTKDKICELLKYLNHRQELQQLCDWTPPKFPVSGHSLLKFGIPKGPALAEALSLFRNIWRDSDYKKDELELLEHLEEVKKQV